MEKIKVLPYGVDGAPPRDVDVSTAISDNLKYCRLGKKLS